MKDLLEHLPGPVTDWMIGSADERRFASGETLIRTGEPTPAIFLLLEGVVRVASPDGSGIATVGPGGLLGEMSFADASPASADVVAAEAGLALEMPRERLRAQLERDPALAASFYRALAATISARLRLTNARLNAAGEERRTDGDPAAGRLFAAVDEWKALLVRLDRLAMREGAIPEDGYREFAACAVGLMGASHEALGPASLLSEAMREELGARLQRELLPYVLTTETAERFYSKPRGYAGDYLAIDMIYRAEPRGAGRIGPLVDRLFLETPPAVAVRNRRSLVAEEILQTVRGKGPGPARVACLASGPAREVLDAYAALEEPARLRATLLDIDLQALALVDEACARLKLSSHVVLANENLLALFLGRGKTSLPPQDLIYSIGITDYLNDKLFLKLLDFCHARLAPGGRVIVGNFHPRNPAREFMDHVLEWKLIHRSEEEMHRLFEASAFGRTCTRIVFEASGIDLFAECVKT